MCRPVTPCRWSACLLFVFFGMVWCSGCHRTIRTLDPHTYRSEVHLQPLPVAAGNPYAYEHKIRGDILLSRGNSSDAVAAFQLAAAADPSDPWLQVQYAEALMIDNDLERARVHLAKAIQYGPAIGRAWAAVAQLHYRGGETDRAIAAALFGAQIDRQDTSALRWLGDHYARKADEVSQKKALLYFQRALVRNPSDSALYLAAGIVSLQLHHIDLAERYLGTYLERHGRDIKPIVKAATRFSEQGYTPEAIVLLQKVQHRRPLADDVRRRLVNLYLQTHQFPEVVITVLAFFEEPDTPEQIEERTEWLLKAGAPWEARKLLVEHFSAFPTHPRVRYQLARIESMLLRDEIALALLNFSGDAPEALIQKAKLLKKTLNERRQPD